MAIDWYDAAPRLFGVALLWAAGIKAISPHGFRGHLAQLGFIPPGILPFAAPTVAGLEAAWGMSLVAALAPSKVLPASLGLLVLLTATSVWTVRSGRATDCGCYGGYLNPSVWQGVWLNSLFALLVILGLRTTAISKGGDVTFLLALGAGLVTTALATISQRFEERQGRPLFDLSPLKPGRKWRDAWAGGLTVKERDDVIVSFLGIDCPHCHQWIRVLNAVNQSGSLPAVCAVFAASEAQVTAFAESRQIHFPTGLIPRALMSRLTHAVPTTVVITSGIIQSRWTGHITPEFYERFKAAFFSSP